MRIITAVFSILMGCALIGTWTVLFAQGQVSDLMTTRFQTTCLLIAEAMTGLSLIAAGAGTIVRASWGMPLTLVSLGMLQYVATYYTGILGQQGNLRGSLFMGAVAITTLALLGCLVPAASRLCASKKVTEPTGVR
jgi:hypothetical protein